MNERDELLQRLYNIYNLIVKTEQDTNEYCALEYQLRSTKNKIDTESTKGKAKLSMDFFIVIAVVFGVITSLVRRNPSGIVMEQLLPLGIYYAFKKRRPLIAKIAFYGLILTDIYNAWLALSLREVLPTVVMITALIAAAAIVFYFVKFHTSYVEAYNKDVSKDNAPIIQRRNALVEECGLLNAALNESTAGWFPPNYVNFNAVAFFISAMQNQKADTLKELVNLYDDYLYKNQTLQEMQATRQSIEEVISNQRYLQNQMHFSNAMNLYQCIKLSGSKNIYITR